MSEGHRDREHSAHSYGGGCENRDSCEKRICDKDRRRLLGALAVGGSLSLAGCTGVFGTPESDERDRQSYDIDYIEQNEQLTVGESQTLLGVGLDAGLDMPFACKAGFCGQCLAKTDGDATERVKMSMNDVDQLTEEAVEAGFFLPCTSNPRTDMDLDTSVGSADLREFAGEDGEDEDDDDEQTGVRTHTATYVNEQWSIEVPEDENLLEAGESRGMDLPYQCRVGVCGECLAQADGDASEQVEMTENDYGPLDDEAISDGYFLTCTGQPRDDLDLETGVFGDLD